MANNDTPTVPALDDTARSVAGLDDRGLMVQVIHEVRVLHAYVAQIEKEAHDAMGGLTDPDNMMGMAGKMLGLA
jgi:hypothetical protein